MTPTRTYDRGVLPAREFLEAISRVPLVSIDLLLTDPNARLLVGRRSNRPAQGAWFVPGGRILRNEPLAQAFARIARTELGMDVSMGQARLAGVFEHFYDDNFAGVADVGTHYVVLAHQLFCTCGQACAIHPHDGQHEGFRWMDRAELLAEPDVHPNTRAYAACLGDRVALA